MVWGRGRAGHRARWTDDGGPQSVEVQIGPDDNEAVTVRAKLGPAGELFHEVVCEVGFGPIATPQSVGLDDDDYIVHLDMVWIAPDRAGRGWGRRFAEAVMRWGIREGADGILAHSVGYQGRRHSLSYWKSLGFRVLWTMPDPRPGFDSALVWLPLPRGR